MPLRKSILTAAAAAILAATAATPALASASIPTCATRTTCMFQNASYGGTEKDYYNPDNGNTWINLPISERASVEEAGGSDVWFWNRSAGLYTCVPANGENSDLTFPGGFGDPGYMYIDYGVADNCAESAPAGAPGS